MFEMKRGKVYFDLDRVIQQEKALEEKFDEQIMLTNATSESDLLDSDSLDIVDRQAYDADRLAQTSLARWTEEDVPALRHIDDIMDVDTFKSFIVTMIGRGEGDESEDEVELANLGSIRHDYFMKVCLLWETWGWRIRVWLVEVAIRHLTLL